MFRTSMIAIAALALAGPALAGTAFSASLVEPVEAEVEFIANDAVWVCEGTQCAAQLNRSRPTVRTCKEVAEEVGVLASFSSTRGELDAEDLAECNTHAEG